jgi:hypothetical protein
MASWDFIRPLRPEPLSLSAMLGSKQFRASQIRRAVT